MLLYSKPESMTHISPFLSITWTHQTPYNIAYMWRVPQVEGRVSYLLDANPKTNANTREEETLLLLTNYRRSLFSHPCSVHSHSLSNYAFIYGTRRRREYRDR